MRISDWSSDVCSSDLVALAGETVMAGLSCGDPSPLAWEILAAGADDFVAVDDSLVAPAMKSLADGVDGDRPVVAGESGVAGLAVLLAARDDPRLRSAQIGRASGRERVCQYG